MAHHKQPHPRPITNARASFGRQWVLCGILVGLVVATGMLLWSQQQYRKNVEPETKAATTALVCDDQLIGRSAGAIERSDREELSLVADDIKATESYDTDPNCLYVLLWQSLNDVKIAESRYYLNKFEQTYDSAKGVDPAFGDVSLPLLRQQVDDMH